MKKNIIPMIFLFVLLSLSSVFGSTSWTNYGDSGYFNAQGYDSWLFASGYLSGNINLTTFSESVTNSYRPVILRPLDGTLEIDNLIYTFTDSNINVYNADDFSLVSSNNFPDSILGQPIVVNPNGTTGTSLAFVSRDVTGKYINIVNMANSVDVTNVYGIAISNLSTGIIETGYPVDNSFFANLLTNGSIEIVSSLLIPNFVSYTFNHDLGNEYQLSINSSMGAGASRPMFVHDIDGDLSQEIIYSGFSITPSLLEYMVYDVDDDVISCTDTLIPKQYVKNIYVTVGQIGTSTGAKEIIISTYDETFGDDEGENHVLDTSCNVLLTSGDTIHESNHSMPVIADMNYDNLNEICYKTNKNTFLCYNSLYSLILNISLPDSGDQFIAMGEYDGNYTYMELLNRQGIFKILNSSDAVNVYNFTANNEHAMIYPVTMHVTSNFTKDIFIFDSTAIYGYYSSGVPLICGDGLCSASESVVTCPSDCLVIFVNATVSVNEKCTDNENCTSGKCLRGKCTFKVTGELCDSDNECLSETCLDLGYCSKSSLFQSLTASKNETVGDDSNSNNILSFLIMGICAVVGILIGARAHSIIACGFLGIGAFGLSAAVLAIIGWLSPFVIIMLFCLMLVMLAITIGMGMRS